MVYNSNTKQISIFDADGLPLYDFFSLCGELQAAELQACSINSAVVGGYSVDPYWIASTQYGAFVVDLSIPTRPTVVTRIAYPGCDDVSFVTGWKEGQELVLVYRDTCETSLGKELFFFKSEQIGSGS